jgi:hypothetical protein
MVDVVVKIKFNIKTYSQIFNRVGQGYGGVAKFLFTDQYVSYGEVHYFSFTDVDFHCYQSTILV